MTKEKKLTWHIEKRKITDLKPHSKNPREFTEKGMKDLESSINSIGFMQPININQNGTILSGHARALKLKQMGESVVDVYVPSQLLTEKQEEEVLIRANANTAGKWDFDILANEFEDFELQEWGLEIPKMEDLEVDMPDLASGDKEPFQQITFTLADEQAIFIKEKLSEIKEKDVYKYIETLGNENSNGNALYTIFQEWDRLNK
jgi:hypothetical protein